MRRAYGARRIAPCPSEPCVSASVIRRATRAASAGGRPSRTRAASMKRCRRAGGTRTGSGVEGLTPAIVRRSRGADDGDVLGAALGQPHLALAPEDLAHVGTLALHREALELLRLRVERVDG